MEPRVASPDDGRISTARGHAAQHRLDDAEAAYREVLVDAPDTPEALNFVAMCELSRGEFASAQQRLEHAADINPEEPEIWKSLGIIHLAQHHGAEAVDTFDRALGLEPMHFATRLHRGAALEQMGRIEDAVAAYFGALGAAQSHGKWRNDVSTPPELRPIVRHAIAYVDQHRKDIFLQRLQPLRERYGATALTRVEQGLEIYLDEREPDYAPGQACRFFFVPGLSTDAWLPRDALPWLSQLEAAAGAIGDELRAWLAQPIGIEPRLGTDDRAWLKENHVLDGTDDTFAWNAFFFQKTGVPCDPNLRRCPQTAAVLAELPHMQIEGHAPQALFSLLTPGTRVLPRHGVTNARVRVQLPLQVDGTSGLDVGGVEHAWRVGHAEAFDETFEHAMQNRGTATCALLTLDAWHPGLTAAERDAITLLFGAIADFNRQAHVDPPPAE